MMTRPSYPHDFQMKQRQLYCERVPVSRIVKAVGTPVYIYSAKTIVEHIRKLVRAFHGLRPLICFSAKANANLAILRLVVREGAGLDIVSGGELYKALKVGCPPSRIVYASVGKRPEEIRQALRKGIFCFNVESAPELEAIHAIARRERRRAPVALRLNPDVEAQTHRYITTGTSESKFGIDAATILRLVKRHRALPWVQWMGLHLHIGSQITKAGPFLSAIRRAEEVLEQARAAGVPLPWLNLGGGLGIIYKDERPQTPRAFAEKVLPLLRRLRVNLILEPGRFIVGNAGILVASVLYVKQARGKRFAVVDTGMNDLLRPALYGAYHEVIPTTMRTGTANGRYDVVGPICESADFLAKDRRLGAVEPGDQLAVLGAGAYGSTMASNYNGRPRPAEVLVQGATWSVIRRRETLHDLIRQDVVPSTLR